MRIMSVKQVRSFNLKGTFFPLTTATKIILDKVRPAAKKIHQLIYQQGERYGIAGDHCIYLSNQDLLDLEKQGYIEIKKVFNAKRGHRAEIT